MLIFSRPIFKLLCLFRVITDVLCLVTGYGSDGTARAARRLEADQRGDPTYLRQPELCIRHSPSKKFAVRRCSFQLHIQWLLYEGRLFRIKKESP